MILVVLAVDAGVEQMAAPDLVGGPGRRVCCSEAALGLPPSVGRAASLSVLSVGPAGAATGAATGSGAPGVPDRAGPEAAPGLGAAIIVRTISDMPSPWSRGPSECSL